MGFINQSLAQVRDLFLSMTPAARITATLLLGVIVVSLGYLFQGNSAGSAEPLFEGVVLDVHEAARIETAFAQANLTILPRQGGIVMIPRGEKTKYLAAIADAGAMPANFDTLLEQSLNGGLLESNEKGKLRQKAALQRQLSMMVSMMDGVEDAKVLFNVSEPRSISGKQKITATVSVRPSGASEFGAWHQKKIREAIANAIGGTPGDVTIFNQADGAQFSYGAEMSAEEFDDPYHQTKTKVEQLIKAKIDDMLSYIPGVRVQVTAELDTTLNAELRTVKSESEAVPLREMIKDETSTIKQTEDRGRPGLTANGPSRATPDENVAQNENSTTSNDRETENFVPTTEEVRQQAGLAPQRVRAAIQVPSDYIARVWREKNSDADPTDQPDAAALKILEDNYINSIKSSVGQLLPIEPGDTKFANVEVTFFQSLTPDPIEPPSILSEGLAWARANSGSLIMAGLAVVSLLMVRSMVKSIPPADPSLAFAAPKLAAETARPAAGGQRGATGSTGKASSEEKPRPKLRLKTGVTLKDDLTEMVREDPDGAAAVLRSWIGNAG